MNRFPWMGNPRAWVMAGVALAALAALLLTGGLGAKDAGQETPVERRLARILGEIYPGGKIAVMVTESGEDGYAGAVVTAEGLKDVGVALELQRAVRTLLGLEAAQVSVVGEGIGL